ncbi:MAG: polysaccharide export protein [Hyphomicrobiaceae bacterium]|nr:polysaccharide export protein [Hyphomicrobiaceae bacterium]
MCVRRVGFTLAVATLLAGCAHESNFVADAMRADPVAADANGYPTPVPPPVVAVAAQETFGDPGPAPGMPRGPQAVADTDGPYLLDTGDRLRVFVYGQPNLSRLYTVDHEGQITVPLIGSVQARGLTTSQLEGSIRGQLGAEFVRNPQVTVDIQQNRPFFILGEVRNAGQYPYVSGMTVETAVAIAGGYTERASDRRFRISRRVNGYVEQIEAPSDYVVRAGDTVYVFERFL